jgi:hypothetical protein
MFVIAEQQDSREELLRMRRRRVLLVLGIAGLTSVLCGDHHVDPVRHNNF